MFTSFQVEQPSLSKRPSSSSADHPGGRASYYRGSDEEANLSDDPPIFRHSSIVSSSTLRQKTEELEAKSTNHNEPVEVPYAPRDDEENEDDDFNSLLDETIDTHNKASTDHLGGHRNYWRDIILGVNDGLVSTFLLVAGVAGGGMATTDILLTAVAGSVAGAVSMCAGEYMATKSQNEVMRGEIALEERHVRDHRRAELIEVKELLERIGISSEDRELQKRLVKHYAQNSRALLKIMVALELGFLEVTDRSPIVAGLVSFGLFLLGAIPSVVPFMIPDSTSSTALLIAAVITTTALMLVGAIKTWATRGNCVVAAGENLFVAAVGGGLAYGSGWIFELIMQNH